MAPSLGVVAGLTVGTGVLPGHINEGTLRGLFTKETSKLQSHMDLGSVLCSATFQARGIEHLTATFWTTVSSSVKWAQ